MNISLANLNLPSNRPRGPQGPIGIDGPQGPIGPQGSFGPQGFQGPTGADGADGNEGFGAIRNVMIDDTFSLDIRKQNFIYGKMQVDGLFQNSGEVVVQNGELLIGAGELIGSGDVTIVTI